MLRRFLLATLALLLVPLACSDANRDNYAKAAAATGVAVAAVGIHRAITNDCWARCSPGYLCNEESGICEPGECLPGCEVGYHCVRDVRGATYCARDGDYPRGRRAAPSRPLADAGVATLGPRDAGADAEDGSPADAATDAAAAESGGDGGSDAAPEASR